ncbi:MAG: hypothetical protein A2283_15175 [Lentisphaerae bacterium RIFOXYA12_FULL_48_11]|nr:MAG: hypothetical protein A2283_15175 [Lentisphaerae bacterium RIFOXYA12_FULL_48_11]
MAMYLISRRSFLRTTSAAVAGSMTFPLFIQGGQGKGKKELGRRSNVKFNNFNGHYSLRGITPVLGKYDLPAGKLHTDKWSLKYDMHICMASRSPAEEVVSSPSGTLVLEKDGNVYRMLHELKNGPELVCTETNIKTGESGALGWKANRSFVLQGVTLPAYEETATLVEKTVKWSRQKEMNSLELSVRLMSLPQLVSAMMKKNIPAAFAFLDEQCAVMDEHVAKGVESINVSCAKGNVALSGFRQHGRGTHPVHYWLDERGTPVFITRGLRSYILTAIG